MIKTVVLDNIFSKSELFFLYQQIISTPSWTVGTTSTDIYYDSNKNYAGGACLKVKEKNQLPTNYSWYLYGQSVVFRIAKLLEEKKIGIHTELDRMWFLSTTNGDPLHFLHQDEQENNYQSILLFLTPIWETGWRGSFYVDGEEFNFKPGSAVIFDSQKYHTGEDPISETYNWQRLTCNIMVKKK